MKEHLGKIVLALGVVIVLLVSTVAFEVDQLTDIVLVKTFDEVTAVHMGSQPEQAGLHFKWPYPFQRIVRYDMRAQLVEAATSEQITQDKSNVLVGLFCSWRISDPRTFNKSLVEMDKASKMLRDRLPAFGGAAISHHDMNQLINTDPARMQLAQVEEETRKDLQESVRDYGIEIVRVGVKSVSLVGESVKSVIEAQKAEREAEAKDLESAGQSAAKTISARAKTAREIILSFADRKAAEIRSRGMEQAAEIYKQFGQQPELAMFLRTLESLQAELQKHSVILLDSSVLPGVGWLKTNRPQMADMTVDISGRNAPQPAKAEDKQAQPPAAKPPVDKPVRVGEEKKAESKPAPSKDDKKAPATRPADNR